MSEADRRRRRWRYGWGFSRDAMEMLEVGVRKRVPFAYALAAVPLWILGALAVSMVGFAVAPGGPVGFILIGLMLFGGPALTLWVAGRWLRR